MVNVEKSNLVRSGSVVLKGGQLYQWRGLKGRLPYM